MSTIARNPVLGAIINILLFGAADLYVGRIFSGLVKMSLYLCFMLAGGWLTYSLGSQMQWPIAALYVVFAAFTGYQTVVSSIRKES